MKKMLIAFVFVSLYSIGNLMARGSQGESGQFEIVFIPKLIGIPWFNAMEDGFKAFAKDTGGIKITVSGAPEADPAQQARVLEDAIARKPDSIIVVPNDTKVLEPIMKKGREAGILMLTQEAVSAENVDADIEFLFPEQVGKDYMEALVRGMGEPAGGYAIMVGGLTVESHNARADNAVKYQKENYPGLYQVTSRLEGSESVEQARSKTLELLQAYDDLKGILYIGTLGAIGGALAVTEKNMADKISIAGTSVPSQVKRYLVDGSVDGNVISNPYRIGYDSAYIIHSLARNGKNTSAIRSVPEYGEVKVTGKVITFHAPAEVTAENAASFGF